MDAIRKLFATNKLVNIFPKHCIYLSCQIGYFFALHRHCGCYGDVVAQVPQFMLERVQELCLG